MFLLVRDRSYACVRSRTARQAATSGGMPISASLMRSPA
ncbi:hypothetical protein PAMC26577_39515 [Caballeronia sordidicola]|uniref:Uncharacterized protein n=1 Tax=Caballeronia sordidicola TaxID=196367 RepID=A0A242M2T8_CABSO|nr:hypothetical protein PAMC26577_39515 [Caballeronia sordidicola]